MTDFPIPPFPVVYKLTSIEDLLGILEVGLPTNHRP